MADDNTGDAPAANPTADDKPAEPNVPAGAENPDAVRNALKAERTAAKEAAKRAEAAEARLAELEERDKSEVEKAQGKLTKAEQRAADAEAKLLRYEVATELNVPAKLVPLLTATSEEGLREQATLLLENAKPADASDFDSGARTPVEDTSSDPKTALGQGLLKALENRR